MKLQPVRPKDRFLVFGSPLIEEPEIEEVIATLRSGWVGTGPKVARFEEEFASYKGSPHAIAVNSCTAALHLSLLAADLPAGSEVITTPLTFCATVNAIIHAGCRPVLADIDPRTLNIDPQCVEAAISGRTAAIVPVHFAGRPCAMDPIMELAEKHHLAVIEDCAHAIESSRHGRPTGTFGDFGCFSFYVTKNIITGEGGMVLTPDPDKAARVRRLALHGMSADAWNRFGDEGYKHYYVVECGFKYNMTDLQAAIGLHQLKRIEQYHKRRLQIRKMYDNALKSLPVVLPSPLDPDTTDSCHLYQILIDEKRTGITRDQFLQRMTFHGIGVGVHYLSLPEHPWYQQCFGWNPALYPHAKRVGRQTVSLPIGPKLHDEDVHDVIAAVERSLSE
ncbi:MAG: DegT/DnrJ/EryC1/StrS family aminotransferase [Chitinispirillaceae bacterium]|nr:DegT/DnrJ/EryC1/StrS family aminotransferase [Chitinispirillaceae bacterium]